MSLPPGWLVRHAAHHRRSFLRHGERPVWQAPGAGVSAAARAEGIVSAGVADCAACCFLGSL